MSGSRDEFRGAAEGRCAEGKGWEIRPRSGLPSSLFLGGFHGRWYNPVIALWLSPNEKGDYLYGGGGQDAINVARLSAGAPAAPSPGRSEPKELSALVFKKIIKQNAQAYGVPWQVVAGVLESEMQLDTGWDDPIEDGFLMDYPYLTDMGWLPLVGSHLSNPGVSVGNVHILTARATAKYFATNYSSSAPLQLGIQPGESNSSVFGKLLGVPFSIRAMTANIRGLADFRFGSGGEPSFVSHPNLSDWTIVDAVAVWHGYRYGIPDGRISPGGEGFGTVEDFQDRSLNLDDFINRKVTGTKGEPKKSARDSEKYFQAYWSMPD